MVWNSLGALVQPVSGSMLVSIPASSAPFQMLRFKPPVFPQSEYVPFEAFMSEVLGTDQNRLPLVKFQIWPGVYSVAKFDRPSTAVTGSWRYIFIRPEFRLPTATGGWTWVDVGYWT